MSGNGGVKGWLEPRVAKVLVAGGRFILSGLNFAMTGVCTLWLAMNAFTMNTITGVQTFHADRVLQSVADPSTTAGFGLVYLPTVNLTTVLPGKVPTMYEVYGVKWMYRLDTIHCNFILFGALWVSSAFSLAAIQLPWDHQLQWGKVRLFVVHTWNFVGLSFTVVIFTATTNWSSVPISNLFYSLIFQRMGWVYQYFYMVQCTRQRAAENETDNQKDDNTEMRRLIYTEFSVVMPLLLISTMMPGATGIDAWGVQTVFSGSWPLYTLLGLHLGYRKSLSGENAGQPDFEDAVSGIDGLG